MESHTALAEPRTSSVVTVAHAVYALHALSLGIGAFTAASVVGAFLFGWPSIFAVILNYALRGDARNTWVESHYRWQIRTFWIAAAWSIPLAIISFPVMPIALGVGIWAIGCVLLGLWASVRIIRGWLRLKHHETI